MKRPEHDYAGTPLQALIEEVRAHTRQALAQVALRLARSLGERANSKDPLAAALAFAERFAADTGPIPRHRQVHRLDDGLHRDLDHLERSPRA